MGAGAVIGGSGQRPRRTGTRAMIARTTFGIFITLRRFHQDRYDSSRWRSSDLQRSFLSMQLDVATGDRPQMRGRVMHCGRPFMERHQLVDRSLLITSETNARVGLVLVRHRASSRRDRWSRAPLPTREARESSFIVDTAINDTIVVE